MAPASRADTIVASLESPQPMRCGPSLQISPGLDTVEAIRSEPTMKSPDDRTPTDFDLRELDSLRRLDSHQEIAIARAMDYCATHQIHPPEWLVEAAALLVVDLLKREKSTQRGRTASCLARFRHEFWDMERWDAVQEVRRIRSMAKRNRDRRRAHKRP
jgi:hypothetical protein